MQLVDLAVWGGADCAGTSGVQEYIVELNLTERNVVD